MPKKIIALFVSLAVCLTAFSQNASGAPSAPKVLSGSDVDAFVKNFDAIDTDLSALGDKYDELFRGEEDSSPAALSASIHKTEVPTEVQSIFRKYGLGDNGFEKVMVMTLGFMLVEVDDVLHQQQKAELSPEAKDSVEKSLVQVRDLKVAIHDDDLALIESRRDQLRSVLTEPAND